MKVRPAVFIAIVTSLFAGLHGHALAADKPSPEGSDVLGRIGDLEVKVEDIRASLSNLGARDEAAISRDPAVLNQVVRSLLVQKIILKEALAKQWEQQPAVAAQLEQVRQSTISESYLQSLTKPPADYPNEAELKSAYESSKASILVPRSYRLSQIFISSLKGADKATADQAQSKLEMIRKSLKPKDADFAAIASAESEERESASRGGEIGWLSETQIQPEIRSQLTSLTLNAISEPIRLDDGWHIIKVIDIREPYTPTLDQLRSQLVQQLRTERTRSNSQAYIAKLLQENPLAINELALSKILPGELAKVKSDSR
ncbi:MAG: hypothetical protein RL693_1293 [Verrucomicrobiota bacterium]|jgi:parvulin-like peptidyl-prolyl isomerase